VLSQYGQNLSKSYVAVLKNNYNNYEIYSSWQFSDSSHTFIPHLSQVQNRRQQYIDWEQMGEAGEILAGESYDFPLSLITLAKVSGPGFIHLCPIFCDNKYWGFLLTLQTQRADIIDAELEKYVLRTISDSIGSALKRYEINLELRKSVEVKTQFMSSMSHEIRTPLNGIVGMINLMESTLLTAEQKEYLAAVRSAGKQLMNLINNILDISRIEAGKTVLRSEPFELGACIKAATSIVNYELKEKSLTLNVRLDAALPRVVKGDETRLKQIIVNLLHNSIKFTDSGTISVEIQRLSKKKLKFTVSDTGIGMTKEQIKNIFQPFYQAGDAAQNLKGTGLGLAISKQLVDMMNGKIVVESEPGKGTSITFSAELPILEESEFYSGMEVKPSEALPNHISGTTTQRNILFLLGSDLDDKVMQSYLFSKGYNHRIAYSWQEVLEQIDNEHTLLIIINLSQSNLEHPELIPALKKAFVDYPSKRWLVLAAFSCDDLHDETFPADRVACQAKPLDFDKILLYIQNAVEQGRMESESKTRGMKLEKH
ncbi:MAG: ATP-binding protein, partial [Candidatus Cloacimonetes bacterium]|nr:ATP-binding protein [Candidatus Cloacimonadota bacterium]